jgi:hypothetical protein
MTQKTLVEMIPIWTASTPPTTANENDFLVKINASNDSTKNGYFYLAVQWCVAEKDYYAEPVTVLENSQILKKEIFAEPEVLLKLRVQLTQLGIRRDKNFFDASEQRKNYQEQLADIHPALVPQKIK